MAALAGDAPNFAGILGYVAGRAGERAEAQRILTALERRPPGNTAFAIALVHLGLGHNEQALRWLQAAYEERVGQRQPAATHVASSASDKSLGVQDRPS